MEEKRAIDGLGAAALVGFAALLAINQVVIKVTADGISPVFQAGLRSLGGLFILLTWTRIFPVSLAIPRAALPWGILSGCLFAYEFLLLFAALDLTTVARASIMFYTMPVWLAVGAHFLLPGERLDRTRILGLVLAMTGVVVALAAGGRGGPGDIRGDLMALTGAWGWAGIALLVRATPLAQVPPVAQLMIQLVVSAPILLVAAPLFGPLMRDPQPLHWAGLGFQVIAVAGFGFLFWFWLMKIYRANGIASFSFLSPVFAVIFGWALLGESIAAPVWAALGLVTLGLILINRK